MFGTDFSDAENAESMMRMFVGLPAEVITQGVTVSRTHEEFSRFFCAEYFEEDSEEKDSRYMGFRNVLSIFRIVVYGPRTTFQEW
jgi:hypothetical protein